MAGGTGGGTGAAGNIDATFDNGGGGTTTGGVDQMVVLVFKICEILNYKLLEKAARIYTNTIGIYAFMQLKNLYMTQRAI